MADGTNTTTTRETLEDDARARWQRDMDFSVRYFRGQMPCDDCSIFVKRGEPCETCDSTGFVISRDHRSIAWYADSLTIDAQELIGGICDVVARCDVEGIPEPARALLEQLRALGPSVALAVRVAAEMSTVLDDLAPADDAE